MLHRGNDGLEYFCTGHIVCLNQSAFALSALGEDSERVAPVLLDLRSCYVAPPRFAFLDRFILGKLAGIIGVDPVFANLAPLKGVLELNGTPNAKPEAERIQYNS